jgi:hypothetical protein
MLIKFWFLSDQATENAVLLITLSKFYIAGSLVSPSVDRAVVSPVSLLIFGYDNVQFRYSRGERLCIIALTFGDFVVQDCSALSLPNR